MLVIKCMKGWVTVSDDVKYGELNEQVIFTDCLSVAYNVETGPYVTTESLGGGSASVELKVH